MKKTFSIRKALLSSVTLLTLLPMLTAVTVSVVMFHLDTSERIRNENVRVAQTVATAVDLFLARPVVMLKQLRDEVDEDSGADFRNLRHIANSTLDTDPLFELVQFVDAAGVLVGSAGPVEENANLQKKQNFSENELFKRLKKKGAVEWSEPFVSLRTGESVISVAVPWRGGMIAGTMNLSYLCKLVEPTRTSQNAYAFIVSPSGRLIAHPDRALVGEKEKFISIPQITAGFQGTGGTYAFTLVGRKVIGTVLPFSKNEWVIVSVHDKAQSFATLYHLERLLGLLAFAVLAGALFIAYRRVSSITGPLQALSESSRKLAVGEKVADAYNFSVYSEVHELYENFQKMAAAVSQREQTLHERNEELAVAEEELRHQVDEYWRTYDELVTEKVKLESILAGMGEGLCILDRDYRVVLQNAAHRKLVGDAVGRFCYEVYDHGSAICSDCPLKLAFADGMDHVKLRQSKDGDKQLYLEISASPLRNAQNEIVGGIEVVRDVTDRMKVDKEVRRLNQELEERVIERTAELEIANRELESFSYSVSHDLRAPLRHISSFTSLLESDYAARLDKDGQFYLSRIIAGCGKMGLLIDDLLELSQVTRRELRTTRVDLSRIVHSVAAALIESEPQRTVSFRIEDGLVVPGDERLLEVMLNNIIGNAWKYTAQKPEAVIEFACQNIASRPVFFIRDNGAGFDMNCADKLFTPFQRIHGDEFEGTGIGLAIVQRIVHRHGGKIWADAAPGEGATFFFTLSMRDARINEA
jgi:signal transduction histidine kinase